MLSPAKLNLGLSIGARRSSDGYHTLSTIFVPISFGDEIHFESDATHSSPSPSLISENLLPSHQFAEFEQVSERGDWTKNLLYQCILKLKQYVSGSLQIHLRKRIPTGGGLGGGSSNAGILMRYLGQQYTIPERVLHPLAASLGADVPFFLAGKPAYARGIGEILQPVEIGQGYGIIVVPTIGVSTRDAYLWLKRPLHVGPESRTLSDLTDDRKDALARGNFASLRSWTNDFEEVVFERHPRLSAIKNALLRFGADYASMTGSGSVLFCLTSSPEKAGAILQLTREEFPECAAHEFQILSSF